MIGNITSFYQIIDPFVEVEIIGLPVDCSKEQTRVVDDNGELMERLTLHTHLRQGICFEWEATQ